MLFRSLIDVSLSDKTCKYLITDDYGSTSSKMIIAKNKNIEILTYGDFFENYKTKSMKNNIEKI